MKKQAGKKIEPLRPGINDLQTRFPDLAKEWHPTMNWPLTPDQIKPGYSKKVWWLYPYDDPKTGKHFDFEWEASPSSRTYKKAGCPYLNNKAVWKGYNDLQTTHPDLAKEWHPTKNGDLRPDQVVAGYKKKVWWLYPYDDPETGKHFDFEWEATPNGRAYHESGCPYLSNKAVWKGYNDLQTKKPDLAKEWHPTKNGDLRPDQVGVGYNKKVWWLYPYNDPETGKHFDFEWEATPNSRTSGETGCPFLSNKDVWTGYNDLKTCCPDIAEEWHPTKNFDKKPEKTMKSAHEKVWWRCKAGHDYYISVYLRTVKGAGCRECDKIRRRNGYRDD